MDGKKMLIDLLVAHSKDTGEDVQRYIDDISENGAETIVRRKAIYFGIPSTGCFPHYKCPLCGVNFTAFAVYVDQKKGKCCPKCKKTLRGLD